MAIKGECDNPTGDDYEWVDNYYKYWGKNNIDRTYTGKPLPSDEGIKRFLSSRDNLGVSPWRKDDLDKYIEENYKIDESIKAMNDRFDNLEHTTGKWLEKVFGISRT